MLSKPENPRLAVKINHLNIKKNKPLKASNFKVTNLSCFSATASRSASGSLANTTVAPSLSASANDKVCTRTQACTLLEEKASRGPSVHAMQLLGTYQDAFPLLRIRILDRGELGIGVFLLFHSVRRLQVKSLEGLLDELVADAVHRRVHNLHL